MPFARHTHPLAMSLPTRIRWLLLAVTLVWLTGCALSNSKKSSLRDPTVHGDKFSCGESCPKGRTP